MIWTHFRLPILDNSQKDRPLVSRVLQDQRYPVERYLGCLVGRISDRLGAGRPGCPIIAHGPFSNSPQAASFLFATDSE